MNISKVEETKFFKKIVNQMKNYIVKYIPKKQLISLYLAGRILTPDRAPSSDIELFGIVTSDFKIETEKRINAFFIQNPVFCGNREGKFHAFYISDFEGRTNGISPICRNREAVQLWIKLFPFYPLVYGKKINFKKFGIEEINEIDELKKAIFFAESTINAFRKNGFSCREKAPFTTVQNLVKWIMHIARLEAVLLGKWVYDIHFYKLRNVLKKETNHIFHYALNIRKENKNLSLQEKRVLIVKAEKYIQDIKKQFLL